MAISPPSKLLCTQQLSTWQFNLQKSYISSGLLKAVQYRNMMSVRKKQRGPAPGRNTGCIKIKLQRFEIRSFQNL